MKGTPWTIALAICPTIAADLTAGIVQTRRDGTKVSIEGDIYRIDYPPATGVRTHDVEISRDADTTAVFINHQNRTWYRRGEERVRFYTTSSRFGDSAPSSANPRRS